VGISIADRHRAFGDAEATAKLFTKLVARDPDFVVIKEFLNRNSKQTALPPHLDKASFDKLPAQTGVYYFHDHIGNVVYVGKANNIKERVAEHFSGNTHTKDRQLFLTNIKDVTFEVTGNELLAFLLENESIKKYFPRYNRTNKTFDLNHGIYTYEDQNGFMRALVGKAGKRDKPVTTFKTVSQATTAILKLSVQFRLCLRLNGLLSQGETTCGYGHSKDDTCLACGPTRDVVMYNRNFQLAMNELLGNKSYIIKTKGRKLDEEGFVYVEKGKFLGFGYVSQDEQITSPEELKGFLKGCYDTQDSQTIIHTFLKKSVLMTSHPMPIYRLY
jgi:DNA polymerase-3 subunit epsilon